MNVALTELPINLGNRSLPGVDFTVRVGTSEFGTPCPSIRIAMPRGGNTERKLYRRTKATAYLVAAQVELATPRNCSWVVNVDASEGYATIALELMVGSDAEVQAAIETLTAAVSKVGK